MNHSNDVWKDFFFSKEPFGYYVNDRQMNTHAIYPLD